MNLYLMINQKIIKMKNLIVKPIGKKVLIKIAEQSRFVPGTNIIIPDTALEKEYKGIVIAVGKDVIEAGEIKVGDLIQYADYSVPTEMKHNGEKHLLINVGDVFAVIEEA